MLAKLLPIFLAATPVIRFSDTPPDETGLGEASASTEPQEGLWPSPKLIDLILARRADEVGRHYDLDEQQRRRVRELVVRRWSDFLAENRPLIQPLANEFLEMRMELEPPSKEQVQAWAKRTGPLFEGMEAQVRESLREFREVLHPSQRPDFELDVLKVEAAMKLAEHKLQRWREGDVDPNDFWEPLPLDRQERGETRRKEPGASEPGATDSRPKSKPPDQIDRELDGWDKYVEQFIKAHDLDEGQRNAVLSCLTELKGRAVDHRDRHRVDIAELERRIAECGGSEDELDDLKPQLTELYGPIDDMFKELETRIGQLLTAAQRARAAERRKQKDAAPSNKHRDKASAVEKPTPDKGSKDQ